MTPTRTLSRLCLALLLALILPLAGAGRAAADCADLLATPDEPPGYDVALVQAGLRTALRDGNRRLNDALIGSYTRGALQKLCRDVPRAGSVPDTLATLELAVEYGRLAERAAAWPVDASSPEAPDPATRWATRLLAPEFAAGLAADRTAVLRLAATPAMTAAVLGQPRIAPDCGAAGALIFDPDATRAARIIGRATGATTLPALCLALPVEGDLD
ncbi:MAG: hypothetical protein ACP5EN_16940, partial [Rhodovulum sp.]